MEAPPANDPNQLVEFLRSNRPNGWSEYEGDDWHVHIGQWTTDDLERVAGAARSSNTSLTGICT